MAKKDNKNLVYAIIAIVVVVIIVAIVMMRPKAEAEPVVVPEEPKTEEPAAPAPSQAPEVSDDGIDYGSRGILSDVECAEGKMSAIITNVQDEEMNIVPNTYENDLRIIVNGIVSKWFSCDKEVLAAGEYTVCDDLLGPQMASRLTADTRNEVSVWFLSDPSNRGTVSDVDCS